MTILVADIHIISAVAVRLGILGWIVILGLSLVNYGLRFLRWHAYMLRLGNRIPIVRHLAYYLAGFAFTTTPGKAGEAIRSIYLNQHRVTYKNSFAVLFVERFVDLAAMVVLSLAAVYAFQESHWPIAIVTTLVVVMLPLIRSRGLQCFLGWSANRIESSRIKALLTNISGILQSSSILLRSSALFGGLLIGLLSWGAEGFAFSLILDLLEVDISVWMALGIYAAGMLVGAASFIPGGLGSTEGAMILLLSVAGVDTSTAIAATFICRIATLWFAVAIGFLAIGLLEACGIRLSIKNLLKSNHNR
jgi:glycosyltransferase 2 family protein